MVANSDGGIFMLTDESRVNHHSACNPLSRAVPVQDGAMSVENAVADLTYHDLLSADDLPLGQMRLFTLAGEEVLVCHAAGGFFAVRNRCPHAESPLVGGRLRQNSISCPLHGARFDLASGGALGGTGYRPLACFSVRVEGGRVLVGVKG
jgi:3-phenylpropionate/trans-cinnamate dioxygenase ferredoxin subunit